MTVLLHRSRRLLAILLLALGFSFTPIRDNRASAQQNSNAPPGSPGNPAEPGEEKGTGRPLDGYLGTAVLVFLALFIVGKSARR